MCAARTSQTFTASITADGRLRGDDGTLYSSPSAWALHCKRQLQPDKKTDDGYRSVRYGAQAGPTLEALKQSLLVRRRRAAQQQGAAGSWLQPSPACARAYRPR